MVCLHNHYVYLLIVLVPFQAAQRLVVEERTRTITEQLDELRRQSENMAKTQKMVEDVIKRKRKR